jgi:hypothetical protein
MTPALFVFIFLFSRFLPSRRSIYNLTVARLVVAVDEVCYCKPYTLQTDIKITSQRNTANISDEGIDTAAKEDAPAILLYCFVQYICAEETSCSTQVMERAHTHTE